MADRPPSNEGLGVIQQRLFIPLAARARENAKKRPLIRDPKAAGILASVDFDVAKYGQGQGGFVAVLRTAIFDTWVRDFLAEHPAGTSPTCPKPRRSSPASPPASPAPSWPSIRTPSG